MKAIVAILLCVVFSSCAQAKHRKSTHSRNNPAKHEPDYSSLAPILRKHL